MLPLERIVNIKMMVSAAILVTSVMAPMTRAFATQATEAAPQDMTCKEFVDMSQQYKTAIAFVIVNKIRTLKAMIMFSCMRWKRKLYRKWLKCVISIRIQNWVNWL